MGEIKKMSVKLIFWAFAISLFIIGFNAFKEGAIDYLQPILILFGVVILAIELGLKKFTDLSNLKKLTLINYISLGLIVVLGIYGLFLLPVVPLSAPTILVSISNFAMFILAGWILVETVA